NLFRVEQASSKEGWLATASGLAPDRDRSAAGRTAAHQSTTRRGRAWRGSRTAPQGRRESRRLPASRSRTSAPARSLRAQPDLRPTPPKDRGGAKCPPQPPRG